MDTTEATRPQDLDVPAERLRVHGDDVATVLAGLRREASNLPVLRRPRAAGRLPRTWQGVTLRLQSALWEVAARADIPVRPGASVDDVARLLVGHGAIIPPAGDAVRALASVVEAECDADSANLHGVGEAASLAERLAGYLALRARFG
jgi:hypothetical protein